MKIQPFFYPISILFYTGNPLFMLSYAYETGKAFIFSVSACVDSGPFFMTFKDTPADTKLGSPNNLEKHLLRQVIIRYAILTF